MRNPTVGIFRSIFAFTALFAVAGVHAQTKITIQTANSVNKQILAVSFAPPPTGSTLVLNSDLSSVIRIESLALSTNTSDNIDLFAADNLNHNVLQYSSDFTICPPSPPNPPACTVGTPVVPQGTINYPNGLSVDNAGNLFVVNDAPGKSPQPAVYALSQRAANGTFGTVTRIDRPGSLGAQQAVVESMIVGTPLGTVTGQPPVGSLANVGDLLVVSQNPDEILIYKGNGGLGPLQPNQPLTVLIRQCSKPHGDTNCIPAGSTPGGIAVWPADNSLIVTTFNGQILQFATQSGQIVGPTVINGAPSALYKVNTAVQAGGAVGFVAQSGPGNHGSILELVPGANGTIQVSQMSVTAGIAAPHAIAVTNTQQAPFASCISQAQGCDLFGGNTNVYKVNPRGTPNPNSNVVESLCIVAKDPRLPLCPSAGSTLTVNDLCPGFDTTGHGMIIPDYACGSPGFALIKSLTPPTQFNLTYTDSRQDPKSVFSASTAPVCGPNPNFPAAAPGAGVFWAPNGGETLIVEGVPSGTIKNPTSFAPTLVDTTEGCWGDPGPGGGHPTVSIFASNLTFSLPGGNTQANLQTFAANNYTNLKNTITQLSAGANWNVNPALASQLTNASLGNPGTGCVDMSLSLFNKAANEPAGQEQQQIPDFQDAADLLMNADPTYQTTCDSIITTAAASAHPENYFREDSGTQVYNPSGQIEWRLAEISNAIRMRILNQPAASTFPPPVTLSMSPQYVVGSCTQTGCPQPPQVSTATLSWALVNDPALTNCSWSNTDAPGFNVPAPSASGFAPVGAYTPPPAAPGSKPKSYTYELTCNVPAGTVPSNTVTLAAGSGYANGALKNNWPGSNGMNYQVTLSTGQTLSPCTFASSSKNFTCPPTTITGTPSATIEVSPPLSAFTYLTVWPAIGIQAGPSTSGVTITWTPPTSAAAWTSGGATGCTLTTNGAGGNAALSGNTDNHTASPQYVATYAPTSADYNKTVAFTATCTSGASAGVTSILVLPPVMVSVSPPGVVASDPMNNSTTVTWTPPGAATGCALAGNGTGTLGASTPVGSGYQATYTSASGDTGPPNSGTVTFTANCNTGAFPGGAQLAVSP
jgi:hypothetical protein